MSLHILTTTEYNEYALHLNVPRWTVVCFCAAWCTACRQWLPVFTQLAQQDPDIDFLWIDIEDHATLMGELDIENFPSISIEYDGIVSFFGTVHPDKMLVKRLIENQRALSFEQIKTQANATHEHIQWQQACLKNMFKTVQ